ncbi:Smr/MutS family protein [Frigidibacter sp. MR17.14]|uniref:Smr/MutS family protein n=1 Tax=Frigidibacter sp. MR17.14 TaxID=3126509 RepID=UPI003012E711
MARRRKGLSEEDRALWDHVAKSVHKTKAEPLAPPPPEPEPPFVAPKPSKRLIDAFRLGEKAAGALPRHDLAPGPAARLAAQPVQMDAGQHRKMVRGRLAPEARIDLHGMTLSEAHPELIRFILNAHADGLRLVLVITGKGKFRDEPGPIPRRVGALRHQVPQWLQMMPLGAVVLQVSGAHLKHGGEGAYYVYLRRTR